MLVICKIHAKNDIKIHAKNDIKVFSYDLFSAI